MGAGVRLASWKSCDRKPISTRRSSVAARRGAGGGATAGATIELCAVEGFASGLVVEVAGAVGCMGGDAAGDDGGAIDVGWLAGAGAWASCVGAGVGSTRGASSDDRTGLAFAVNARCDCEAKRLADAVGAGGDFAAVEGFGDRAANMAVAFAGARLPGARAASLADGVDFGFVRAIGGNGAMSGLRFGSASGAPLAFALPAAVSATRSSVAAGSGSGAGFSAATDAGAS
jgi:hypothetical protein